MELRMTSLLTKVNQSDLVIIDKHLSASSDDAVSGGGGGGGGSGSGGGGSGSISSNAVNDSGTSPSPAIWLSYNSSSANTIENSNASRHLADHPETSGAVGIEAIIIVAIVSLIPVSVIACMVFVISFNCLKKRNAPWSTSTSPNTIENNLMAKRRSQMAGSGNGGGGSGSDRRESTIRSIMQNVNVPDAYSSNGENGRCCRVGQNDERIATMDTHTPLSFIYPADAFSAHMDASKGSLTTTTTPISSNSVITMTMRNNHLIVETEERVPCYSLSDGQNFYVCDADGGAVVVDGYTSCLIQECELNGYDDDDDDDDDGGGGGGGGHDIFDETDSSGENRCCQQTSATYMGDEKCALCDDVHIYGTDRVAAFHCAPSLPSPPPPPPPSSSLSTVTATTVLSSINNANRPAEDEDEEEEDKHVQIFHKNLPAVATDISQQQHHHHHHHHHQQQQHQETLGKNYDDDDDDVDDNFGKENLETIENDAETNAKADTSTVRVSTGYSQCDATDSSSSTWRRAQSDCAYAYGNQSEFVSSAKFDARSKRRSAIMAYKRDGDGYGDLLNACGESYGCDRTSRRDDRQDLQPDFES